MHRLIRAGPVFIQTNGNATVRLTDVDFSTPRALNFIDYSIVDSNSSWSLLSFLEAFYIKRFSPALNKGLKASKELQLFS